MKKIIYLLFAVSMFTFTACGPAAQKDGGTPGDQDSINPDTTSTVIQPAIIDSDSTEGDSL